MTIQDASFYVSVVNGKVHMAIDLDGKSKDYTAKSADWLDQYHECKDWYSANMPAGHTDSDADILAIWKTAASNLQAI